jgi:predicted nucleic acid-binding protein
VLTPINLIVDDDAGMLPPSRLRTPDAIHLAAAQRAERSLRAVVTYDARTSKGQVLLF